MTEEEEPKTTGVSSLSGLSWAGALATTAYDAFGKRRGTVFLLSPKYGMWRATWLDDNKAREFGSREAGVRWIEKQYEKLQIKAVQRALRSDDV